MLGISILFPLAAIAGSIAAYLQPELFAPFSAAIVPLLTVIMFAMGLTLTPDDFKRVALRPRAVGLGVLLQFTIMPLAALAIGTALALPPELLAGFVLLGSCPGGTASNVIRYLAKANVALSVTMTMVSSLLAVVATPVITWALVGQTVDVSVGAMLLSLVQIVLLPVLIGVAINTFFHQQLARLKPALPVVATTAIVIVIAIIVALNRNNLALIGPAVFAAVVLHNLAGLTGGYAIARLFGFDRITCRTLAIEVGMQNSGLGVALALQYFSALAALPGAIFSIWHNLSGAMLAGWWSRHPTDDSPRQAEAGPATSE
jgi:BASS family bile acid:Na+ symporter